MKFINPLPFVRDIAISKAFYTDIMQLEIIEDHGNFVRFSGGFALHDGQSLHQTIFTTAPETAPFGRDNLVLYFEDENLAQAFARISPHVPVIHPIEIQAWGQNVFRFYDPDHQIIEIGELH